ncbi:NlpC/P60 family protein [Nonomuraea sp. NPDC050786]|uniref:NlpC/P60 family protein n=1 Tax=Nonomuraea sp. NPDC050786 TaxID=3154840 RepID=UPI0033D803B0
MATIRNLLLRLGVDVDPLDKGFAKAAKTVGTFDKHFSKISKAGAIGAGLGAATGAATAFTAAIAPAAGALIAVPAAMAATKVATGTLKVGLIGVSDAMSALADGDAKKLNEALEKLSPNARAFVKASGGFLQSFKPIQQAVQDKLFDGLAKQMGPLTKNLLPTAKRGLTDVAGQFNKAAKNAISFGKSAQGQAVLNTVFKTTSNIMGTLAGATKPALQLVSGLVVAGAPLAEQMAKWAANGVKAASAFVNSEQGAAKLSGWADKAKLTLEGLGRIGRNLAGFLGGIFSGAKSSGDGVLTTLEQITAKMSTWAQSAGGQKQITDTFALLKEILTQVAAVLPIFLGPLGAVATILSGMSPEVRGVVAQFLAFSLVGAVVAGKLKGIVTVAKGLTMGVVGAGGALIKFGSGLVSGAAGLDKNAGAAAKAGAAVRTFGSTMKTGIVHSAGLVTKLSALAWEKGKVAAQAGLAATKTAAMTLAQKASAVASKAMAVAIRLVNAAMRANPIGIIITIILALVGVIVLAYNKNETFRKIVQNVWKGIQAAISYAWNNVLKPAFTWIWNFIVNVLGPKFLWFHNNVVKPVFSAVGRAISTVWTGVIKPVFSSLATFITKTVPGAFQTGVKAIGTFWDKVKAIAKAPVTFLVNTVYNKGIRGIWNWVASKVGLPQLPEIRGFATGGRIAQGTHGTADDVLIKASRGEFIVNAASTKRNAGLIDYVNRFGRNRDVLKAAGYAGDPGGLGIPGYAGGGIVGWVQGFIQKGKSFFMDGFYRAAKGALDPIVSAARTGMGNTGLGGLLSAGVQKIVDGVLSKFKPLESELGGGGGGKVVAAARKQIGMPYSWGGGGPGGPSYGIGRGAGTYGFDCSGLTEYAWYQAIRRSIGGTTYAQKGILQRISQPRPGAVGQPHPDHTYLMSAPGKIIEAPFTGGFVREVPMRSTPWWGWPKGVTMDDGGVIRPGWNAPIYNGTGRTEGVFTSDMIKAMAGGRGGDKTYHLTVQVAPGTSPAEVGRQIVEQIKAYERTNGTRWRGNP